MVDFMLRPVLTPVLKPVLRPVFYKQELPPPEKYVARLDRATQCWVLDPPINLLVNDILELSFVGGETGQSTGYFLGDENYKFACFASSDSVFFGGYGNIPKLNDKEFIYSNSDTPVPLSGLHKLRLKITREAILGYIGARNSRTGLIGLALYGFKHIRNDVVLSEIPLTNKAQGANQLATVGNINAIMINYTGDEWEQLP